MRNALTGHSNAKALTVTLRSPRTPAGGPLLEPKRDQHGWRQRVPILSERKGVHRVNATTYLTCNTHTAAAVLTQGDFIN